jgi:hypothetical protein
VEKIPFAKESRSDDMGQSLQPPHMAQSFGNQFEQVAGAAFPYCLYNSETIKDSGN